MSISPSLLISYCTAFFYCNQHKLNAPIITKERTIIGSVSDRRNRYWVYRIESATVVSADITCITAGSSTVDGSHYTQMMIKGCSSDPSPARRARTRDTGEGWRKGRRKETPVIAVTTSLIKSLSGRKRESGVWEFFFGTMKQ